VIKIKKPRGEKKNENREKSRGNERSRDCNGKLQQGFQVEVFRDIFGKRLNLKKNETL
jgi:hypothetical protein